jgi:hypothetical protein
MKHGKAFAAHLNIGYAHKIVLHRISEHKEARKHAEGTGGTAAAAHRCAFGGMPCRLTGTARSDAATAARGKLVGRRVPWHERAAPAILSIQGYNTMIRLDHISSDQIRLVVGVQAPACVHLNVYGLAHHQLLCAQGRQMACAAPGGLFTLSWEDGGYGFAMLTLSTIAPQRVDLQKVFGSISKRNRRQASIQTSGGPWHVSSFPGSSCAHAAHPQENHDPLSMNDDGLAAWTQALTG